MGCLRKAYSWPSNKGSGSFLVLKENLPAGKKTQAAKGASSTSCCCHRGGRRQQVQGYHTEPPMAVMGFEIARNVSGVLNPGQL